jgi:hypothetical protein
MKTIGKYTKKPYVCRKCGHEIETKTNHWGSICNIYCEGCQELSTWDCTEEMPIGYKKPEEWKKIILLS